VAAFAPTTIALAARIRPAGNAPVCARQRAPRRILPTTSAPIWGRSIPGPYRYA